MIGLPLSMEATIQYDIDNMDNIIPLYFLISFSLEY